LHELFPKNAATEAGVKIPARLSIPTEALPDNKERANCRSADNVTETAARSRLIPSQRIDIRCTQDKQPGNHLQRNGKRGIDQ
jgi:hypothetical protein